MGKLRRFATRTLKGVLLVFENETGIIPRAPLHGNGSGTDGPQPPFNKELLSAAMRTGVPQYEVLTLKETAFFLRISIRRLYYLIEEGRLTPAHLGPRRQVFLRSEINRFLLDSMRPAIELELERAQGQRAA